MDRYLTHAQQAIVERQFRDGMKRALRRSHWLTRPLPRHTTLVLVCEELLQLRSRYPRDWANYEAFVCPRIATMTRTGLSPRKECDRACEFIRAFIGDWVFFHNWLRAGEPKLWDLPSAAFNELRIEWCQYMARELAVRERTIWRRLLRMVGL